MNQMGNGASDGRGINVLTVPSAEHGHHRHKITPKFLLSHPS